MPKKKTRQDGPTLFDLPATIKKERPVQQHDERFPPVSATIHFDGLCEPVNPGGHCCYGYMVSTDDGQLITGKGSAGTGTNNKAEYTALIESLKHAKRLGIKEIHAFGDSLLVVNQIRGVWAVNSDAIKPLWKQAVHLSQSFALFDIKHIPRKQNAEADKLSRQAYKDITGVAPQSKMEEKARELVQEGMVTHIKGNTYKVKEYTVDIGTRHCPCTYHKERKRDCKHILAAEIYSEKQHKESGE